jgi:hypothetical protein
LKDYFDDDAFPNNFNAFLDSPTYKQAADGVRTQTLTALDDFHRGLRRMGISPQTTFFFEHFNEDLKKDFAGYIDAQKLNLKNSGTILNDMFKGEPVGPRILTPAEQMKVRC